MINLKTILAILLSANFLIAQNDVFNRFNEIPVPDIENTGFGEFISGVDFDNDGNIEIIAVNNMLDQGGAELTPRIYKFEKNGTSWDLVWSEKLRDIPQQNSWAPLTWGDWDQDGKMDVVWGPANFFNGDNGPNPNPPRIIVFEAQGGGKDNMGAPNFGFDVPNAEWTITDKDNFELRPFRWILTDFDNDGQTELVFAERRDSLRFGVVSVSNIPDNGNGSEVWTLEASAANTPLNTSRIYDMALLNNKIFLIHSDGSITLISYDNGSYNVIGNFPDMVPGGSWKSSSTVDIDNDGTKEIIVGSWENKIYLIQEDPIDTIKSTLISDLESLIGVNGRINGGHDAFGDIDGDGNLDFVFGTREATPDAAIIRLEYQGGDITQPQNYVAQVIDSLYPGTGVNRYDKTDLTNVDDDPDLEVLYTDGNQTGRIPIVFLDLDRTVGISEEKLSADFQLYQNFPNPFNPATTIKFSLDKSDYISLKIYNTLGQEIVRLIDNINFSQGKYSVTFNGANLASGVYIYSLETSNFKITKKMILNK